jgi:Bacterial regulatory proteins, gntR family
MLTPNDHPGPPVADLVPLGEDDQARVRMPLAAERNTYALAGDEPVVEVRRWNGTTDIHPASGKVFAFVSGEHEPGREQRLATIRRMVDDLAAILCSGRSLPPEERLVVRYEVSRTTVRRALAQLRDRGVWPDVVVDWPTVQYGPA